MSQWKQARLATLRVAVNLRPHIYHCMWKLDMFPRLVKLCYAETRKLTHRGGTDTRGSGWNLSGCNA